LVSSSALSCCFSNCFVGETLLKAEGAILACDGTVPQLEAGDTSLELRDSNLSIISRILERLDTDSRGLGERLRSDGGLADLSTIDTFCGLVDRLLADALQGLVDCNI